MKYVVVIDNEGNESPILFPESVVHSTISPLKTVVVSAGFCYKENGKWMASSRSESLRKESRSVDSELLQRYFK